MKNRKRFLAAMAMVMGAAALCAALSTNPPDKILKSVSVSEAAAMIAAEAANTNFIIIDVRTPGEYAQSYISNAVNVNYNDAAFSELISEFDRGGMYLIYCKAGSRSAKALEVMRGLEFREVYNMNGGITAWIEAVLPVVKP